MGESVGLWGTKSDNAPNKNYTLTAFFG